ncbi:MAG: MoxR family ATPase [Candidatus Lokiarchaeota archaeon]
MVKALEIVKEIQEKFNLIGRTHELQKILLARKVNKNILLEGDVGVGKTTLAKAVSSYFDTNFFRIDCSEETLPHNLVGYWDPPLVISKGYNEDTYTYGPLASAMVNGGCLFINEINRMPESTQNTLLTALDENIIEIPKLKTIHAENSFFTIATLNPTAHIGVTALGEAIKDRFVWIELDYQSPKEEQLIIIQNANIKGDDAEKIAYISQRIIQRTRDSTYIRRGSSIRGAIDLAALMQSQNIESSKRWIESAIMALYNKIELEDDTAKSKKEIIKDIVIAVLNKTDFQ